jgi:DNA-binding transcriptional ArsR family regulator
MPRAARTATEMVITDVEALKVISDPLRLEILELISSERERSWTAKEIAGALGTRQTKLYHHLKLMEQHGFLRVAETRMVSGILERRYAAAAHGYRVARELLAGSAGEAALATTLDALFEKARAEIVAGVHAGLISGEEDPKRPRMTLTATHARLSPAGVRKVMRQIERIASLEEVDEPGGEHYGLLLAFYPRTGDEPDR